MTALRLDGREPLRVCLAGGTKRALVRFSHAGAGADGTAIEVGAAIELRRDAGPDCAQDDAAPRPAPVGLHFVEEIERGEWALF